MNRHDLAKWIATYEEAWRAEGTELVQSLFAENATYKPGPFSGRARGLACDPRNVGEPTSTQRTAGTTAGERPS